VAERATTGPVAVGAALLLAAALAGGCAGPRGPSTLAEMLTPPPPPPPPAGLSAETAWQLRGRVVLGERLLGGAAAHAAAPAGPPEAGLPAAGVTEATVASPLVRARSRASAATERALAAERLLELWARGEVPDASARRNDPGDVRQAQRLLAALGYYGGSTSGTYGPATRDAVRRFQAIHALAETGDVTPSLLTALRAAL
jgi:hypothetical protein